MRRTRSCSHPHKSVILSDRSGAKGVEGPAVAFRREYPRTAIQPLPSVLFLAFDAGPVLKLIGEELAVEICHSLLQACLCVRNGLVVNRRPYLLNEKVEQQPRAKIADRLRQILFEVALYGSDCSRARLFGQFNIHTPEESPPLRDFTAASDLAR